MALVHVHGATTVDALTPGDAVATVQEKLDDGTIVSITPACAAMEISSESTSPIQKLKERVERTMVETATKSTSTAKEASGP